MKKAISFLALFLAIYSLSQGNTPPKEYNYTTAPKKTPVGNLPLVRVCGITPTISSSEKCIKKCTALSLTRTPLNLFAVALPKLSYLKGLNSEGYNPMLTMLNAPFTRLTCLAGPIGAGSKANICSLYL